MRKLVIEFNITDKGPEGREVELTAVGILNLDDVGVILNAFNQFIMDTMEHAEARGAASNEIH